MILLSYLHSYVYHIRRPRVGPRWRADTRIKQTTKVFETRYTHTHTHVCVHIIVCLSECESAGVGIRGISASICRPRYILCFIHVQYVRYLQATSWTQYYSIELATRVHTARRVAYLWFIPRKPVRRYTVGIGILH